MTLPERAKVGFSNTTFGLIFLKIVLVVRIFLIIFRTMEAKKDKYLKWRIIEYLHGDFCDSSPGVELKTPKPKRKARPVKNRRAKIADIPRQSRNEKAVSTEIQCFSPELDTCRIFFPCADFIDLDKFLPSIACAK